MSDRRGQGPLITAFHASGKWSKTKAPAFDSNVRRLRRGSGPGRRTLGSRTEATARGFNRELTWPGDGWGLHHPAEGPGHDCSLEWAHDEWTHIERGVLQLTDTRIRTRFGHLLEPCALTWAVLGHEPSGIELELGSVHLDLSNTARRRAANLESCHTLRAHYQEEQVRHPQRRQLLQFDGNRDQRDAHWCAYFATELAGGTRLRSGWHKPYPARGTHGRKLLDLAMADFPITTHLLPSYFQPPSDHTPIETSGRL